MSQQAKYRKKGDPAPEEDKEQVEEQQDHQEGRGQRGRGNRGYNNQFGRGQGRGRAHYKKKGEGEEEEGGEESHGQNQGRGYRRHQQDQDSWYYKYHYGQWPKNERVEITLQTEIPPLIPKEERKKEPKHNIFEQEMKKLDDQIFECRNKIKSIDQKKREFLEGGTIGNSKVTYREYLNEKIQGTKGLREERQRLHDQINEIQDQLNYIEEERQVLKKQVSRDFQKPDEILQQIDNLQKKYETQTLNKELEKKTMNEIKFLKNSIKSAERLQELKPDADALFDKRKELRNKLTAVKAEIQGKETEIGEIRKQQEEAQAQRTNLNEKKQEFEDQIQKVKEQMAKLQEKKTEVKEQYYKDLYEYKIEASQIKHIEKMMMVKRRLIENEELKKKRAEERKQEMIERVNPYEKEIETCEHVVAYMIRKKVEAGLIKEENIHEFQNQVTNEENKQAVEKRINDGKMERALTKEEKEQEGMIKIGGGRAKKGGKGAKKQKAGVVVAEVFNLDTHAIQLFGFLKVAPPLDPSELDPKIEEIQALKEKFKQEGEKKLNEFMENGEELEDENEEEKQGNGHKYGKGRDGRGTRKGEEEEGETYDDGHKHKHATRQSKKEDLQKDNDNFPTL